MERIAVIGAGNGGMAVASHLTMSGVKVSLCDLFPQYVEGILKEGGIHLTGAADEGFATVDLVTTVVSEAVRGAKLIMVVTPAFSHAMIAEALSGCLTDGQMVMLNPGRTGGALCFLRALRQCGCTCDVTVAEAQTLVYSCRKSGPASVDVKGVKAYVEVASIPADRIESVLCMLRDVYPQFVPAQSSLKTGLSNIGAMFHPAPVLMNAGRIESGGGPFEYYREGMSPSVIALVEGLDAERMAVARGYGLSVLSVREWLERSYGVNGSSLWELIQTNRAYEGVYAPDTMDARYVTEDVPNGLVPIAELGRAADVPTPLTDALIVVLGSVYGRDFRSEGRNLSSMGLSDMDKAGVIGCFDAGVWHDRG